MKRQFLAVILAIVLILAIPTTVYAVTPRALIIHPILQFAGRNAICAVMITSEQTDEIEAEIKLWKGTVCVETWNEDGIGFINFKESTTVTSAGEYTLTVDVIINNVEKPQVSDSAVCE